MLFSNESVINFLKVRHEVTAAFAADAVSRISGVPGVACVRPLLFLPFSKICYSCIYFIA